MLSLERYYDFKNGVVNAIEASESPKESLYKCQNWFYSENRFRKMPGLVEKNDDPISDNSIFGIGKYYDVAKKEKKIIVSCGNGVYVFDEGTRTFSEIFHGIFLDSQVEFLDDSPYLYFGSQNDKWRRFTGGTITYPIGGDNGEAADSPRKFISILFNPYAGRYFGIGDPDNPDYLNFSAHIDNEGIEKWPTNNVQIIGSFKGDTPKHQDTYEGRITIFNENSINSGSVVGVPESWSFQKEKAQAGTIARRTVKRYGNSFFMLTKDFEIYQWPKDVFITKGRVKFSINPYRAHLACAEIVNNRYYDICFESGEAVSENKYHWWRYDILGDRWFGPHIQRNIVSMYWDSDESKLLCGGTDDLNGFLMELRGLDIKNKAMKCHLISNFEHHGDYRNDKRYHIARLKSKQSGGDSVRMIINVDNNYSQTQSQEITLEDPANQNTTDTNAVKDSIIKRGHILEENGLGVSIQTELIHEVLSGDCEISGWEIEYYGKTKKENRGV